MLLAVLPLSCHPATGDQHEQPIPVEVHCAPAQRQSVDVNETLRGRVAAPPGGDLPVASQVPGRVLEVLVHEGDHVAPGAVVASIDGSASRDALRQADAAVAQARSAEANAQATLDRVRQLVARGIAAKQELDDATAREDQATAGVNAALAASDLARRTLGRVQVRSTFAGIVTRVWRGSGALVDGTAATPIVQLAATQLEEFDVDATEEQLVGVAPEQPATITLATGGDPIPGTVRARSTALDPATGLGLVRIAIAPAVPVTLGVFGTAMVTVGKRDGVLVVPATSMRGAVADGAELVVCKDGKAEVRTVKVGWRDDQRVEVVEGLADAERVASDHVLGLETDSPIVEAR
ncbi:MAG TPA: efflux RND transporter periplasmic adaptor subunit [Polyangiaceae bacterium]